MANTGNTPETPYKEAEFEAFIASIGEDGLGSWGIIAQAIGVDPDTIRRWKKHPRAKKAIQDALKESIEGMTRAGADDWRMHREKAKMLGVEDTQNIDIKSGGQPIAPAQIVYVLPDGTNPPDTDNIDPNA